MKLNSDLPIWIAIPLRLVLYGFVFYILFNVALGVLQGRIANNQQECDSIISKKEGGLKYAKYMVGCLQERNGFFENLMMRSTYRAVDALPNNPQQFVGVWEAAQPRCKYRHTLQANGRFVSEPRGCTISYSTYHGDWGVYDNKMVWLLDDGKGWPPDINAMDVVDKDFFLLEERDGSRTRLTREGTATGVAQTGDMSEGSPDMAIAKGYAWAKEKDVRSHADCRAQWTVENHQSLERSGCSKYVTEMNVGEREKPFSRGRNWDDGTTTEQCYEAVRAYWEPISRDAKERNEDIAALNVLTEEINSDLHECLNYDNVRIIRQVYQPQGRLDEILKRVKGGGEFTAKDRITIQHDYPGVERYQENPYRTKYLSDADELFGLVGGRDRVITELSKHYEELYTRLDQLQAEGVGMSSHQPAAAKQSSDNSADDSPDEQEPAQQEKFVPMTRSQFRAEQDRKFAELAKKSEEMNRKSAARLTSFLDGVKQACGNKLNDYPDIGMSDEEFRNCTIYARTGGIKQVVTDEYQSKPLRLYFFGSGKMARVYSIDGVITAIRP